MVAIMVIAYSRQLRDHHDSTSAVAAIATVAIGFLAGNGNPALAIACAAVGVALLALRQELHGFVERLDADDVKALARYAVDRKSTRLNSSHVEISYAVFCLKKKKTR